MLKFVVTKESPHSRRRSRDSGHASPVPSTRSARSTSANSASTTGSCDSVSPGVPGSDAVFEVDTTVSSAGPEAALSRRCSLPRRKLSLGRAPRLDSITQPLSGVPQRSASTLETSSSSSVSGQDNYAQANGRRRYISRKQSQQYTPTGSNHYTTGFVSPARDLYTPLSLSSQRSNGDSYTPLSATVLSPVSMSSYSSEERARSQSRSSSGSRGSVSREAPGPAPAKPAYSVPLQQRILRSSASTTAEPANRDDGSRPSLPPRHYSQAEIAALHADQPPASADPSVISADSSSYVLLRKPHRLSNAGPLLESPEHGELQQRLSQTRFKSQERPLSYHHSIRSAAQTGSKEDLSGSPPHLLTQSSLCLSSGNYSHSASSFGTSFNSVFSSVDLSDSEMQKPPVPPKPRVSLPPPVPAPRITKFAPDGIICPLSEERTRATPSPRTTSLIHTSSQQQQFSVVRPFSIVTSPSIVSPAPYKPMVTSSYVARSSAPVAQSRAESTPPQQKFPLMEYDVSPPPRSRSPSPVRKGELVDEGFSKTPPPTRLELDLPQLLETEADALCQRLANEIYDTNIELYRALKPQTSHALLYRVLYGALKPSSRRSTADSCECQVSKDGTFTQLCEEALEFLKRKQEALAKSLPQHTAELAQAFQKLMAVSPHAPHLVSLESCVRLLLSVASRLAKADKQDAARYNALQEQLTDAAMLWEDLRQIELDEHSCEVVSEYLTSIMEAHTLKEEIALTESKLSSLSSYSLSLSIA